MSLQQFCSAAREVTARLEAFIEAPSSARRSALDEAARTLSALSEGVRIPSDVQRGLEFVTGVYLALPQAADSADLEAAAQAASAGEAADTRSLQTYLATNCP